MFLDHKGRGGDGVREGRGVWSHAQKVTGSLMFYFRSQLCDILAGDSVISVAYSTAAGDCLLLNQMTDSPHMA